MQKDYRPYWLKKLYLNYRSWYVERYLRPRFTYLGDFGTFMKPHHIRINGANISLGKCATVVAETDRHVSIGVWDTGDGDGEISIGDYVMISPGVRISAAKSIRIGHSCMMANGAYLTDSDWHGVYDRVGRDESNQPIVIGDNVWIGDHATVLKGVSIGNNSIVAAGAVVTKPVPENVVVAGNPAKQVRALDSTIPFKTRADFFSDPAALQREYDNIDRVVLEGNTLLGYLRYLMSPKSSDQ